MRKVYLFIIFLNGKEFYLLLFYITSRSHALFGVLFLRNLIANLCGADVIREKINC